jgi:hypothetical protein
MNSLETHVKQNNLTDVSEYKNIRSGIIHDSEFFWTVKSQGTCKDEGIDYISPQQLSIDKQNKDNITIVKQLKKNHRLYGNMSYDNLSKIWMEDNQLNEVLRDEKKPYFDIEFTADNQQDAFKKLNTVRHFIKDLFKSNFNIDICLKTQMRTTGNITCKWGKGIYADMIKYSFHIIINNGYKFANNDDLMKFKNFMQGEVMKRGDLLYGNNEPMIDFAVYSKNRNFKLPYQSKADKKNPQVPLTQLAGLYKEYELKEFLISYGIEDYKTIDVSNIETKTSDRMKNIRKKYNINNNITFNNSELSTVDLYYQYLETVKGDYKINIKLNNLSPEELIKCIYIDDNMSYDIYWRIGAGLKRCIDDDKKAFIIWDNWTKKCSNYNYNDNVRQFQGLNNNMIGYNTLYQIASACNDKIKDYDDTIINQLFIEDFTGYEYITTKEDNKRYIDIEEDIIKNNKVTFIKSAMGTGKSYNIHKLLNNNNDYYKKCVYLSARRAFSCSMTKEFECDAFVNYIDKHYTGYEDRQIVSLESLVKCKISSPDLLIIDESETIFNIISSQTLYKNSFHENIKYFYNMIRNAKNILVMDAYLSNRSIRTIYNIFEPMIDITTFYYYKNNYKYEERYGHILDYKKQLDDNSEFLNKIYSELKQNKKITVVCASRTIGEKVISVCDKLNKKYKYYNGKNSLMPDADVNKEWSGFDCLLYTPTITCGISYTNDNYKYDTLFITALNKNSCVIRDTLQAHKRIRNFTNKNIYIYLNTCFKGNSDLMNPTNKELINKLNVDYMKEITGDDYKSIKDDDKDLKWINDTHIYNQLERNINDNHLYKLFLKYCEVENIKIINNNNNNKKEKIKLDIKDKVINYDDVDDIDEEKFNELKNKLDVDYYLEDEEMIKFKKYLYNMQIKDFDNKKDLFKKYFSDDISYKKYKNIKEFNKFINIGEKKYKKIKEKVERIEFYNRDIMKFKHIEKMFKKLNIINDNNQIDINKEFDTLDFDLLVNDYKKFNKLSINQLFDNTYMKDKNEKGEKIEVSTKTIKSILNNLLNENFNMTIKSVKTRQKKIDGKKKKITVYKIVDGDIMNYFNNDIYSEDIKYNINI